MTKTEQFNKKVESITDAELAEKCSKALSKLCQTGGKSFRMCVPPMVNDTDILFAELIKRFENCNKWISVEDRLPGKQINKVLAQTGEWNGVQVIEFSGGEFIDQLEYYHKDITEYVTHWQPLPEPPKEDEK